MDLSPGSLGRTPNHSVLNFLICIIGRAMSSVKFSVIFLVVALRDYILLPGFIAVFFTLNIVLIPIKLSKFVAV